MASSLQATGGCIGCSAVGGSGLRLQTARPGSWPASLPVESGTRRSANVAPKSAERSALSPTALEKDRPLRGPGLGLLRGRGALISCQRHEAESPATAMSQRALAGPPPGPPLKSSCEVSFFFSRRLCALAVWEPALRLSLMVALPFGTALRARLGELWLSPCHLVSHRFSIPALPAPCT